VRAILGDVGLPLLVRAVLARRVGLEICDTAADRIAHALDHGAKELAEPVGGDRRRRRPASLVLLRRLPRHELRQARDDLVCGGGRNHEIAPSRGRPSTEEARPRRRCARKAE
jgi:hypothetical protein